MIINEREDMDAPTLKKILELVYLHTGITMSVYKKTMLQGRLRSRVKKLGLASFSSYIDYLNKEKNEVQEFINLVTTNETSFFRTQRVWDYFSREFLPKWIEMNPEKTLRIWSAASSSGEEVYSIGIACEEFRSINPKFNYQILGTDISSEVLNLAESAQYSGRSIENFKNSNAKVFEKYMKKSGDVFTVSDIVKSKIRFGIHNLFGPSLLTNAYDIVFVRNVLIYFDKEDQERVLLNISKALVKDGTLIIGESESLNGLRTNYVFKCPFIYTNSGNFNE